MRTMRWNEDWEMEKSIAESSEFKLESAGSILHNFGARNIFAAVSVTGKAVSESIWTVSRGSSE